MSHTLQFDPKTIAILKNYTTINPSIYFRKGSIIGTTSPSRTVMSYAKVTDTFDSDFAIYSLSKFLSILSIFKNPDIIIEDKFLTIKEDGRSVNYTFCDPSNIRIPPEYDKVDLGSPLVDFSLTSEQLVGILKATSILQLPVLDISSNGELISIRGFNEENPSDNSYSVVVGESDLTFNVFLAVENIKLIVGDYNVSIFKTPKGTVIIKFYNDTIEYYNAAGTNSEI